MNERYVVVRLIARPGMDSIANRSCWEMVTFTTVDGAWLVMPPLSWYDSAPGAEELGPLCRLN